MSEPMEIVRGSGDVFRDFDHAHAAVEQAKSLLAARIIKSMDAAGLSARAMAERSGIPTADLSRIRNAKLDRFTIDRLMSLLVRLEPMIDVRLTVRRKAA